jgi:hypothetical protein
LTAWRAPSANAWRIVAVQALAVLPFVWLAGSGGWVVSISEQRALDPSLGAFYPESFQRFRISLAAGAVVLLGWFASSRAWRTRATWTSLLTILATAVLFHVLTATRVLQFPISGDDSYIDYRHVLNLAQHGSLDYHVGQPVMGFTSHLHLWLLSAIVWSTGSSDVSLVSQMLNLVAQWTVFILLFELLARIAQVRAAGALLAIAIYVMSPYNIQEAVFGKESTILQVLLLLGLHGVARRQGHLIGWSGTAAFLTRPEAITWLAASAFVSYRQDRTGLLRHWALPAALALAWFAILFLHFGTVIPHGALAKQVMYHEVSPLSAARGILAFVLYPYGLGFAPPYVPQLVIVVALFALVARLHAVGSFLVIGLTALFAFFALANPRVMFAWYLAPFVLVHCVMVPLVLAWLWARCAGEYRTALRGLVLGVALLAVFHPARELPQLRYWGSVKPFPLFWWDNGYQRVLLYGVAARHLNAHPPPAGEVVAVSEPGMFGYVYEGQVLDLGGLVSDEMLRYYPVPAAQRAPRVNTSLPVAAVRDLKPAAVLFLDGFAKNGLLSDESFRSSYRLEAYWPVSIFDSQGLYLYRRTAAK